jgi:REP element-mobilizing transposase RayT
MPSIKISKDLRSGIYYLTLTVKNWYYIFDRHNRFQILSDSILYCQRNKGLNIYAYVFMLNHVHLIVECSDTIAFIRDFKKYTSKEIQKNIIATEPNIIWLFRDNVGNSEFWQKTNMPKLIESRNYFLQKVNYIHENPVRKQYVRKPEDWIWSSANSESEIRLDAIEI